MLCCFDCLGVAFYLGDTGLLKDGAGLTVIATLDGTHYFLEIHWVSKDSGYDRWKFQL